MNAIQKKLLAGGLGLALALAAAAAKAQPVSWYIGADVLQLKTEVDDKTGVPPIITGDAKSTTLRLKGGTHILNWLDAELHFVLPNEETFSTAGGTQNGVKTGIFGAFAKPHADFGPLGIYGLAGIASTRYEFSGVVEGSKTKADFAYGLGAQYRFTRNFAASIDWVQYNKTNLEVDFLSGGIDVKASALGIGVSYTF